MGVNTRESVTGYLIEMCVDPRVGQSSERRQSRKKGALSTFGERHLQHNGSISTWHSQACFEERYSVVGDLQSSHSDLQGSKRGFLPLHP